MIGLLSEPMIDELLENNMIGRLGYSDGNRMYIVPISYLFYDRKYILAHSREGQKIEILRKNPNMCLAVDQIENLNNWKSVILWGKYEEITDKRERYYALDLLIRRIYKYKLAENQAAAVHREIEESLILPEREKAVVYRIQIERRSGRFETSEPMPQGKI